MGTRDMNAVVYVQARSIATKRLPLEHVRVHR